MKNPPAVAYCRGMIVSLCGFVNSLCGFRRPTAWVRRGILSGEEADKGRHIGISPLWSHLLTQARNLVFAPPAVRGLYVDVMLRAGSWEINETSRQIAGECGQFAAVFKQQVIQAVLQLVGLKGGSHGVKDTLTGAGISSGVRCNFRDIVGSGLPGQGAADGVPERLIRGLTPRAPRLFAGHNPHPRERGAQALSALMLVIMVAHLAACLFAIWPQFVSSQSNFHRSPHA